MFYGVFAGAYVSLFPATLVELFGVEHFASVNGFLYMVRGFAALVGTPVAGALIRSAGSHADGKVMSQLFFHTSILVGALLVGATVGVVWVRIEAAVSQAGFNGGSTGGSARGSTGGSNRRSNGGFKWRI